MSWYSEDKRPCDKLFEDRQAETFSDKDVGTMPLIKSRNQKIFAMGNEFQMSAVDISSTRKLLLRVFNSVRCVIKVVLCKVIKLLKFGSFFGQSQRCSKSSICD